MGTRHLTAVVVDRQFKIAQYGQWDGYFSGAGVKIAKFIETMDFYQFKENVRHCNFITPEQVKNKWIECGAKPDETFVNFAVADKFNQQYPELDRNIGSGILELVAKQGGMLLQDEIDFVGDSLFCEYAYVLDLDEEVLELYRGFNKKGLPKKQKRFRQYPKQDKYYPVRLVKEVEFRKVTQKLIADLEK